MLEPEHDLTYEICLEHAKERTYLKATSVLNENNGNPYGFCKIIEEQRGFHLRILFISMKRISRFTRLIM